MQSLHWFCFTASISIIFSICSMFAVVDILNDVKKRIEFHDKGGINLTHGQIEDALRQQTAFIEQLQISHREIKDKLDALSGMCPESTVNECSVSSALHDINVDSESETELDNILSTSSRNIATDLAENALEFIKTKSIHDSAILDTELTHDANVPSNATMNESYNIVLADLENATKTIDKKHINENTTLYELLQYVSGAKPDK